MDAARRARACRESSRSRRTPIPGRSDFRLELCDLAPDEADPPLPASIAVQSVAQVPALGLDPEAVGRVARAAGPPFAAYNLGGAGDDVGLRLCRRLFPGRRGVVTLRAR